MNINRCAITVYFLFFSFKTIQNIVRKKVFFIWDVIPESVQYFLTIINNYKIFPDILLDIIYRPLSWSCKIYCMLPNNTSCLALISPKSAQIFSSAKLSLRGSSIFVTIPFSRSSLVNALER